MESSFSTVKRTLLWQRVPANTIHFKARDKEISVLLGYAVFYILSGYLLALVILHFPSPILGAAQFNQDVWYSIVFKLVLLLLVPSLVYFGLWAYSIKDLLLGLKPSAGNISAAIVMMALGFLLNASHLKGLEENIPGFADAPLRLIIGIMMPLFTAAIPEEFYFRGYLQTRMEQKWNRPAAILVSTILFTAWHLPSRYLLSAGVEGQAGDWGQVLLHTGLPVFIIGFVFAMHWARYRNIALLVATHWAIDILPSLSSYFRIGF